MIISIYRERKHEGKVIFDHELGALKAGATSDYDCVMVGRIPAGATRYSTEAGTYLGVCHGWRLSAEDLVSGNFRSTLYGGFLVPIKVLWKLDKQGGGVIPRRNPEIAVSMPIIVQMDDFHDWD